MPVCSLCKRTVNIVTKHHLIPKQKNSDNRVAMVCIPCQKQIHALFTNRELKQQYDTIGKLRKSIKIEKWIDWVNKKNPNNIRYYGKGGFHK